MSPHAPPGASDDAEQRRRAKSRERQLRYRVRKAQHACDLEVSVRRIRGQIAEMERLRACAASLAAPLAVRQAQRTRSLALTTAHRLVDCFAFGFLPSSAAPWLPRPLPDAAAPAARGLAQIAFVEEAVATDVQWGDGRGQNLFLEQWRRLASVGDGFHMDGASAAFDAWAFPGDGGDAASAVCHVRVLVSLAISAATLEAVLPALKQRRPELARRLRGQRVQLPAAFALSLDARGRVRGVEARMDWPLALRPLVGGLAGAAAALDGANLSPAGDIGRSSALGLERMRLAYVLTSLDDAPSVTLV